MMSRMVATALAAYAALPTVALALDPSLPTYEAVSGVSGQLKSVGSDTLVHEMELWADGFRTKYPGVSVTIEGKGSATAPPALLAGTAQFGPMSRLMTSKEAHAFEEKFGYEATAVRVAIDALAIYVNKDNPIQCLNLQQLDRIFSKPRKGSEAKSIDTWGEAGLSGEWAAKPISMYGRNTLSGTYAFFRQLLYQGEFKETVRQQVGSEAVVQEVANDKFAIGYSGIGYKTAGVRTVPVAAFGGDRCYDTSAENTYSGKYPIARYLYIYLNRKPGEPLDALRGEFIKFVLSKDGQTLTEKGGYYAVTAATREAELDELGLLAFSK
jgi:phosphate transport system substrate-binding protein